jgi:hypothetical protein
MNVDCQVAQRGLTSHLDELAMLLKGNGDTADFLQNICWQNESITGSNSVSNPMAG